MEKRLILAVLLSLAILYVWAGLTQQPRNIDTLKDTETTANKYFTKHSDPNPSSGSDLSKTETADMVNGIDETLGDINADRKKNEAIFVLENDKLLVTFSNYGGAIKEVYIKEYDEKLPITGIGAIKGYQSTTFTLDIKNNNQINYKYETPNAVVINNYRLSNNDFIIEHRAKITYRQKMSKDDLLKVNSFTIDSTRMDISNNNRDKSLNEYAISSYNGVFRKSNAFKFNAQKEPDSVESHVIWSAFRNRYFAAIFKPNDDTEGYDIRVPGEETLSVEISAKSEGGRGDTQSLASTIFIGPERHDILSSYGLGLEKVKKFYRFGLFDIIAMAIYRLMNLIYKLVPNWGATIVIISIILYFSMYPLTLRGMASMKRMQAMQPEIAKLKEKYSSNPQKMNQEMMALYKENKINPLGGCLPFLLQMPIFIGLYQVLWRSVSFKGAGFLWIKDLSQPDRFYVLPQKLPFLGDAINLLPILMMVIMFFQQRITAKNMTVTDPMQRQQQKMMGTIMPVFLGVIFYKFASGLTLYFTMFYLFSTFTQLHMYKKKDA